jgi:hypothetical protein
VDEQSRRGTRIGISIEYPKGEMVNIETKVMINGDWD